MLQTVENESIDVEHEYDPQNLTVEKFNETQQEEDQVEKSDDGNVTTKQQPKSKAAAAKKTAARNTFRSSKRKR